MCSAGKSIPASEWHSPLREALILTNDDYAGAPYRPEVARELGRYQLNECTTALDKAEYVEFLRNAFSAVGIWREAFEPSPSSHCFIVSFDGAPAAIFRLSQAEARLHEATRFYCSKPFDHEWRVLEVNNVAVSPELSGGLLLGVIMRACALFAVENRYDCVAGVVRNSVLAYFADFGALPIPSEPLHVLGDHSINDYIIFFPTGTEAHARYARQRAYHYFHQRVTMAAIREIEEDTHG